MGSIFLKEMMPSSFNGLLSLALCLQYGGCLFKSGFKKKLNIINLQRKQYEALVVAWLGKIVLVSLCLMFIDLTYY